MPPARKTARSSMASPATSSRTPAPGSNPRLLFSSSSDAGFRNARRTLHTATQSKRGAAPTSPSKVLAGTSIDGPIILSDDDTDMETMKYDARRILEVDSSDDDIDMTVPRSLVNGSGQTVQGLSLPLSTFDAANNNDESRSSTTLDQSYATSLNSELHVISDGSLSSLSSIDSDSDAADTVDDNKSSAAIVSPRRTPGLARNRAVASTPLRNIEATPEASIPSSSSTPTPSRRSARIDSLGSSVQKALQRRDELDAKMLASPIRRKPESPEVPPVKRPRGRPRKSAPDANLPPKPKTALTALQSPVSASARRSARRSLPASLVARTTAAARVSANLASSRPSTDEKEPSQEQRLTPRRSRRSERLESVAVTQSESKPSPAALVSSSVTTPPVATTSAMGATVAGSIVAQSNATPPVKRGPGRPRKSEIVVKTAPPTPATHVAEDRESFVSNRLRKRSLSSAELIANAKSPPVVQEQQSEPLKRKRGRPARTVVRVSTESSVLSVATLQSQVPAPQSSVSSRNHDIDLLDDDVSELSDASDMSIDSSQQSRSASQTAQPPARRRGRPPGSSTKKLKRASRQDKDGKAYHVTGLYAGEADAVASISTRRPAEIRSTVFPAPIHFGAKLLAEERDFCLPYPIHQSMDQLRDRVNAKRKPPRYQQISKNKYVSRPKLQGEVPLCNCTPGSGCGADCINRMLMFICDPRTCPSASNCTNVSLGRRPTVKTTVSYYGRRGFGLKTLEAIKKDDFIDEYRGEVINLSEAAKRVTEEYKATGNFYLLDYDSAAGELLDGGRRGNITRFANHSCDPNCRIEKFIICGTDEALSAEFQIGLFANRDIAEGEELTYNYGWAAFQPRDITGAPTAQVPSEQCLCGAANCAGILGGKKAPATKAAADVVTANSRKKTAKGRGKGKGKARKSAQSSRVRMRSMTPMLNASRLSAAAMPSSVLLSTKSRKREEAQASLNILDKIINKKRRQRSARAAGAASAPTKETGVDGSSNPAVKESEEITLNADLTSGQQVSSSPSTVPVKAKEPAAPLQASAEPARLSGPAVEATTSAASSTEAMPLGALALTEASTTQGARGERQANASQTISAATGRDIARLPLLKRLAKSRLGSAFGRGATAARGTKDRRWTADLISDTDESSSVEKDLSDSEGTVSDFQQQDDEAPKKTAGKPGRRGRHKLQLSVEEAERRASERRARNAFLARVRRASRRGIVIEDPTQHPLKKISIQCTAAPENTYIPDLPSSLVTLGMTTADARRARNAFLARVRRAIKRGYAKEVAIKMAAKPLPGDPDRDTPVMKAQRAYMEQIEREAAEELTRSDEGSMPASEPASSSIGGQASASAAADRDWVDESSWAAP